MNRRWRHGPHVLAVRQDSLGDVLLSGPAVRAIASTASSVTMVCGRRGIQAGRMLPGVGRLIQATAPWIDPVPGPVIPSETNELIDRFRGMRIDEAVIFTSFHQSPLPMALLLRLAGVGRISAISDEYPGSLLDLRCQISGDVHEVERSLLLADQAGFAIPSGDDAKLRVNLPGRDVPLPFGGAPYVVAHPGTSVPARAWSQRRYCETVDLLVSSGRKVVVTGSRAERHLTAHIAGEHPDVLDVGGKLSFGQLGNVMAAADVVVCGNTGPAHLAAAVGTPVVSLFAPTVPATKWRPWGVPHRILGDQRAPCAGTRLTVCGFEGHPCLESVTAASVVQAVEELDPRRLSDSTPRQAA